MHKAIHRGKKLTLFSYIVITIEMFGAKGAYIMICGKNQLKTLQTCPVLHGLWGVQNTLEYFVFIFLTKGNIYNNLTITMAYSGKNLIHCGQCFCTQSTVHTRAEPACSAFLTFFFGKIYDICTCCIKPFNISLIWPLREK